MNGDRKLRFRIGLFVLTALVLLAGLIYLLGLFPAIFRVGDGKVYYVEFTDAPDVEPNTPVLRSGVKVGRVEKVALDDETGRVLVTLQVDIEYTVRKNQVPTLSVGLFSGDTTIEFVPTKPEGAPPDLTPVPPGTVLRGELAPTVQTLVRRASAVVPPAQEALGRISQSLERLERMSPLVEETLREYRDLAKATREAIPELRKTNEEVWKLIRSANETVPLVRDTVQEIQITARNWGQVGERANVMLRTNEDRINSIIKNTDEATAGLAAVLSPENRADFATILRNVSASSKRFPTITRDTEALVKQGRTTLNQFGDTLRRANEVLDSLYRAAGPDGKGGGILRNFEEAARKFNQAMSDVNELLRVAARGDGTLRRFLTDPSLYNHLDQAVLKATCLLPRIDRVLKDLEVFADKLARHPESIGLGGLVRPSAGIKEPPTRTHYPPVPHP